MELYIAGGVGEHGRNCFYVQGSRVCFLVDCGVMAGDSSDKYPHLSQGQIDRLDVVFLTHSHADHTGALPWLINHGFGGPVIAAGETLRQLPWPLPGAVPLERLCPAGNGSFQKLSIHWGRSGHCAGSVWYHFAESEKSILFSGDYTENTRVYSCDFIRKRSAEAAVLDCAYGRADTSYSAACRQLVQRTAELLDHHPLLLFPVPKFGRGQEILDLFSRHLVGVDFYSDELFLNNLSERNEDSFWYRPSVTESAVSMYEGQSRGIVFVSDPQLRTEGARKTAEQVMSMDGKGVMNGTVERGSFSEAMIRQGNMELLCYPVHQNYEQYCSLVAQNDFGKTIPYHSADFSALPFIEF